MIRELIICLPNLRFRKASNFSETCIITGSGYRFLQKLMLPGNYLNLFAARDYYSLLLAVACLPACLCLSISGVLFVSPSMRPSVCSSFCFLSACLPACLPVCLSPCLSVCLSPCLPVCLSVSMSVCLSVCLHVCLFVSMSFYLSAVSLWFCMSVLPVSSSSWVTNPHRAHGDS